MTPEEMDAEDAAREQRLAAPGALAAAAQWYGHALGVPIFPCVPRAKTPMTRNGFKDASRSDLDIVDWWVQWPDANIGMPTGAASGWDVIDIDGQRGIEELAREDRDELRALLFGAPLVSTPRPGGLHYYLPASTSRKNSAKRLGRGIDTRGDGGYVLLPPSITDEHGPGRRYEWIRPLPVTP